MKLGLTLFQAVVLLGIASPVRADLILESATLGPTGLSPSTASGGFIGDTIFYGARFSVSQSTIVDRVGGHLVRFDIDNSDSIFAAIVPLVGAGDFPVGAPSNFMLLASTLIVPPAASADVQVPLSVTLDPGDYALVFGSGRFGATGQPTLVGNNKVTA